MNKYFSIYHLWRFLFSYTIFVTFTTLCIACSDNIEKGLQAKDESEIEISIWGGDKRLEGLLQVGPAKIDTVLNIKCNARWTVEVINCEWCQLSDDNIQNDEHVNDGSFTLNIDPNPTNSIRECTVMIYVVDKNGTHTDQIVEFQLEQDISNISVAPIGGINLPYSGTIQSENDELVTVTANQSWVVNCTQAWLNIIPGIGMENNTFTMSYGEDIKSISFSLRAEANPSQSARTAEVIISSPDNVFTSRRLSVIQSGAPQFFVTPANVPIIPYTGKTLELQVYSPKEDWTAEVTDWIKIDPAKAKAASKPITVKVTIPINNAESSRNGTIDFIFGEKSNIAVSFTQAGNSLTPVVSTAWIADGWTSTQAQLHAYYQCLGLVSSVEACGAEWYPVDNKSNKEETIGELIDGNEIKVSIEGLISDTQYEAIPYIEYRDSEVSELKRVYGGPTRFTTTRDKPSADDNTPPVIDNQPGDEPGSGDNNPPIIE